jgi:hypothetical protein
VRGRALGGEGREPGRGPGYLLHYQQYPWGPHHLLGLGGPLYLPVACTPLPPLRLLEHLHLLPTAPALSQLSLHPLPLNQYHSPRLPHLLRQCLPPHLHSVTVPGTHCTQLHPANLKALHLHCQPHGHSVSTRPLRPTPRLPDRKQPSLILVQQQQQQQ